MYQMKQLFCNVLLSIMNVATSASVVELCRPLFEGRKVAMYIYICQKATGPYTQCHTGVRNGILYRYSNPVSCRHFVSIIDSK